MGNPANGGGSAPRFFPAEPEWERTTESAGGASARKPKKRTGARTWFKRIALGLLIAVLTLSIIGIAVGVFFYTSISLPDPNKDFQSNNTYMYFSDGRTELARLEVQNRESIPLDQMPNNIKDAVVAIENQSFWSDRGISLWGMARGAFSIATGGSLQGGSTITQQYIKILYLNSEQKVSRKLKELVLAYKMGQEMSKEQLLEGYLNTIYFGRGAYGIQAAAKAYFGVEAKDLTLSQAVTLAAVLNDPGGFNPPAGNMKLLLERYQVTLNNMVEMGRITKQERDTVYTQLPEFAPLSKNSLYGGPNGFLVKMAEDELARNGFSEAQIRGGGLKVTTTIDPTLQQAAIDAVQKNVATANGNARKGADPEGVRAGLASVQVGTGEILALYGGPDYLKNYQNWATTPRPTASVFKINALVAALMDGKSLSTKLNGDSFTPRGDKTPIKNAGGSNFGEVTLLRAASDSINTAFVDLVAKMENGPDKVIRAAKALGLQEDRKSWEPQDRIALGFAEVSPLDEAGALATIANDGQYIAPHLIREVADSSGKVLYSANKNTEQRIPQDVARDTMFALTKVVSEGTATSLKELGYPAGGKTGTRDVEGRTLAAWFTGTTKQIATAVDFIAGNTGAEDLNPYRKSGANFYGSTYPAYTWLDYMKVAMKDLKKEEFADPAYVNKGLKSDDLDTNTGKDPAPDPQPSKSVDVHTVRPSDPPQPSVVPPSPKPDDPDSKPNPSGKPDPPSPSPSVTSTPTSSPSPTEKPRPGPVDPGPKLVER